MSFMCQLLKGVNFEFVESLDTEDLKELEAKYARKSLRFRKKALMLGELGAFKTHAMAWERIAKSGEAGIIIEDSADFVRDASILLSAITSEPDEFYADLPRIKVGDDDE